jgi:hypothetical protein
MTSRDTQTRISQRFAKLALAVLLLSLSSLVVNGGGQTKIKEDHPPSYQDRDGYEVLSVLLNAQGVARKNDTIRIDALTASGERVAEIKAQCSGIPAEFVSASEDFEKKMKTRLLLQREFSLAKNYELARVSDMAGVSQPDVKAEARKRSPAGTYYLAAVGFDEKRTRAVAFVEYICGNLCGESIFYFLRKSEKGWVQAPEAQREVHSCGRIY